MPWNKYSIYYTFDRPVPYKDLLIYPVLVSDFAYFYYCVESILIDKNSIPNVKIISMSYLEYLYYATFIEKSGEYVSLFDALLRIVLKKTEAKSDEFTIRYFYDEKKPVFSVEEKLDNGEIKKTTYDSADFEEIKQIICEQNLVDVPNENISKDLRDEIKKQKEYRQKISGWKPSDLEEQIICITAATAILPEDIYKMSLRKFTKLIRRLDELVHYKIYMTAKMSGMVTFDDKKFPLHWMRDLEKENEFEGLAFSANDVEKKVTLDGKINVDAGNKKKE